MLLFLSNAVVVDTVAVIVAAVIVVVSVVVVVTVVCSVTVVVVDIMRYSPNEYEDNRMNFYH